MKLRRRCLKFVKSEMFARFGEKWRILANMKITHCSSLFILFSNENGHSRQIQKRSQLHSPAAKQHFCKASDEVFRSTHRSGNDFSSRLAVEWRCSKWWSIWAISAWPSLPTFSWKPWESLDAPVPAFVIWNPTVADAVSWIWKCLRGLAVPAPMKPPEVIRSFSDPAVANLRKSSLW